MKSFRMKQWHAKSCPKGQSHIKMCGPKRPRMWVFGYYCHGGIVGITNLTRQRPNLCKLVNAFLQQELPDFTYAAFQIAVDAALAPHRDITNEVGSMSGLIGVSRFEGGRLWVEDRDGMVKRRVAGDEIKVGKLLTVSQQACTFNARAWHGADRHKGVRGIITCYTPRCLHKGNLEVCQCLQDLNFNLPGPTPQQAPAEIKPGIDNNTSTTSHHISDSDDEEDDEDALVGFEGFLASGSSGRCKVCGVTLLSHAPEPIDPWISCVVEEKPPDSSFDEAARERATQLLRSKCSQGMYERHCPKCSESAGHKRKSRRLFFFFHTPFCASSEESVVGLLTTGRGGRRGPGRIRGRGRTACIGPSAHRRGPHANRAWVLRPTRLRGAARGVWRRRRAGPQRRAVQTSGRPRT